MSDSSSHPAAEFLEALRSPEDGTRLSVSSDGRSLIPAKGKPSWPLVGGIPRFVSDEHLKSFGDQWTTFEVAHEDEDRATFAAKTGLAINQLKGLRILDAGCGGGRYAKICGEAGATVFGADHTRAVNKARDLCGHLPHVHFVQADLKQLPFAHASFDFVFSIGVMHHDARTRDVFDAVAKMVRRGGRFSVWLYRRNQWWQELINSGLRSVTTRLPARILTTVSHMGAVLGGIPIVNRTLNKVINFSAHPDYENRVCDTFDWWAPEYQYHHTVEELSGWFREAGFGQLSILPPEKAGRFYTWAYEHNLLIGSGVNISGIRQ